MTGGQIGLLDQVLIDWQIDQADSPEDAVTLPIVVASRRAAEAFAAARAAVSGVEQRITFVQDVTVGQAFLQSALLVSAA